MNDEVAAFIVAEDKRLRQTYGALARGNEWHLTHVLKIMEEVGELAEQVLARQKLNRADKTGNFDETALGDEIADVLITTLLVARDLDVDVNVALARKIAKIEARYPDAARG